MVAHGRRSRKVLTLDSSTTFASVLDRSDSIKEAKALITRFTSDRAIQQTVDVRVAAHRHLCSECFQPLPADCMVPFHMGCTPKGVSLLGGYTHDELMPPSRHN